MDDLIVRGGIVAGQQQDIAVQQGRIRAIAPDLHTAAREQLRHARTKNCRRLSRQMSKLRHRLEEDIAAKRCDLHSLGIALASHQPCPERFPGRRDLGLAALNAEFHFLLHPTR